VTVWDDDDSDDNLGIRKDLVDEFTFNYTGSAGAPPFTKDFDGDRQPPKTKYVS